MLKNSPLIRITITSAGIAIIISFLLTVISFYGVRAENESVSFATILFYTLPRFLLWGLFYPFILKTLEKSSEKSFRNTLIKIGLSVSVLFLHQLLFSLIAWTREVFSRNQETTFAKQFFGSFLSGLYFNLLLYGIIYFIIQATLRNKKLAEAEESSRLLKTELATAQLQALKMQIQPHFLFNALNSISSLVIRDPVYAQNMISKLGDFLRLTLESKENQYVRLSEELYFLQSYLEIEKVRFSDKLVVTIDVSDELLNAVVPHLILQPIVENSIKHGISNLTENGKIEIQVIRANENLQIIVTDNGKANVIEKQSDDKKTGLANLRNRLQCLYADKYRLELNLSENNNRAEIEIPLSFDQENTAPNE